MNYLVEALNMLEARKDAYVDVSPWTSVEDRIGAMLPSEYKIIQEVCGLGQFGFANFRHRLGVDWYTTFDPAELNEWAESIAYVASLSGFSVFPQPGGLIPVGLTGTGINVVCFQASKTETKMGLLHLDTEEFESIEHGFAQLLVESYRGVATSPIAQEFGRMVWPPECRTFFRPFPTRT